MLLYIRKKATNDVARATLVVVPTVDGENYYRDSTGGFWRTYEFT